MKRNIFFPKYVGQLRSNYRMEFDEGHIPIMIMPILSWSLNGDC